MTTYNTGNSIGSHDPRDLYDNAENLDKLASGQALAYTDRLGVPRKSWKGMESDFQNFLLASGYQVLGTYAAGLTITARNQIFLKDGEYYRASAGLALPYTTTGVWAGESASFVSVGDAALRQELAGNTGSALAGFRQLGVSAAVRTALDKLREFVSLEDFGAVGDGMADDTVAIQAAIDSGAKRVRGLPGRTYRITGQLAVAGDHFALDLDGSELLMDDATGLKTHIKIGGLVARVNGTELHNITFKRAQAASAGHAVDFDHVGFAEMRGCRIYGEDRVFGGVQIKRGIVVNVQNNEIQDCIGSGIYVLGTGVGDNRSVDVTVRENRIEACETGLKTYDYTEGLFCRDNIFYNHTTACVSVNASSDAAGLISFKLQDCDFDSPQGLGLYIDTVNNGQVTGCWFATQGGHCLQIGAVADSFVVSGNQFYPGATKTGLIIGGKSVIASGNLVSGGGIGVDVQLTGEDATISGNSISGTSIAVQLSAGAPRSLVSGNKLHGNTAAIVGDGGAGTVVEGNPGDPGVTGYLTVGASPFTHTAGPRPELIAITGGTVSQIDVGADAVFFQTNATMVLRPGEPITITYSAAPNVYRASR